VNEHLATQAINATSLEPLLERLAELLAAKLVPHLQPAATNANEASPPSRRLLTLEQLVQLLPPGKKPGTWRAWFYGRTRLGQVPGQHKIGGRLFFDPEQTLPWLLNQAACGPQRPGVDLAGQASLHERPMPDKATHSPQRGGKR
jgi:hypothetical protein